MSHLTRRHHNSDQIFTGLKDKESAKTVSTGGHISDSIRREEGSMAGGASKTWYGSSGAPLKKEGGGYNPPVVKKDEKK